MNIPFTFKRCTKCNEWLVICQINFKRDKYCKNGLSSRCKECDRRYRENNNSYFKKYYENNKEELLDKRKQYRENHKEYFKEYGRKYYEENKEQLTVKKNKYYKDNKEYFSGLRKKRYETNKDNELKQSKLYRQKNPNKFLNSQARMRASNKEKINEITKEQWSEMMEFFGHKCAYSDETLIEGRRSIDHIIPLANNGVHAIWNCVPMTRSNNSSKRNKNIEEWYKQQPFYTEERLQKIYRWIEYAKEKWGYENENK